MWRVPSCSTASHCQPSNSMPPTRRLQVSTPCALCVDLASLFVFIRLVALVGTNIQEVVQQFTSSMSTDLRAQWFQGAFAITRFSWSTVLKQWSTFLTKIPPLNGRDHIDGPIPLPDYKRAVVADLSSQIITSEELWQILWAWMPEWMTCETPECVFRASRDGYK